MLYCVYGQLSAIKKYPYCIIIISMSIIYVTNRFIMTVLNVTLLLTLRISDFTYGYDEL